MVDKSWEKIYRRVTSKPIFLKDGKPTSALFKDSNGVSVDYEDNRKTDEVIADEERLHKLHNEGVSEAEGGKLKAIISLTCEQCDNEEVCVTPDPIEGENLHHAIITKTETEVELSKGQAKRLARNSVIVKAYA